MATVISKFQSISVWSTSELFEPAEMQDLLETTGFKCDLLLGCPNFVLVMIVKNVIAQAVAWLPVTC